MKHCQRCNLNFPDSLKFCESCGGALGSAVSLRCPACGETAQPGWKFCVKCRAPLPSSGTGDLSRAAESSTLPPTVPLISPQLSATAPLHEDETTLSSQRATVSDAQICVRCRSCRKLVDEDAEFCEFCGASMFETTAPIATPLAQLPTAAPTPYQETYAPTPPPRREVAPSPPPPPTPQHREERSAPTLSILSSYGDTTDTPPATFRWWHGVLLGLFLLLIVGGLGGGAFYWWWSNRSTTPPATVNTNTAPPAESPSASPRTPVQTANGTSAENDLKRLQERVNNAKPSDSEILASLADAEKKYPTDYRFTYERAKLFGKGMISHDEAFDALFAAAHKAIDGNKAQDMLDGMTADKDSDFSKLSRGHHEWQVLMQALSNKDENALKAHVH